MHIESISNGFGAPSMYMMVMAGRGEIPATVSISADTGSENDCLLSNGDRVTAGQFYDEIIKPLGGKIGISTAFVRTVDKNGNKYPPLYQKMAETKEPNGVPLYGSNGGKLKQSCTHKYKTRAVRQELRRMGALTARVALGLTMDECHRMKKADVIWQDIYWPLIDARLYKAEIIQMLDRENIPYMVSSQCDMCPHQNLARWDRLTPASILDIENLESSFKGEYYFTRSLIPLRESIEKMRGEQPSKTLFDACDSGYCFT